IGRNSRKGAILHCTQLIRLGARWRRTGGPRAPTSLSTTQNRNNLVAKRARVGRVIRAEPCGMVRWEGRVRLERLCRYGKVHKVFAVHDLRSMFSCRLVSLPRGQLLAGSPTPASRLPKSDTRQPARYPSG